MTQEHKDIELLAEQCARKYHSGQFREYSNLLAITHPEAVVGILKRHGFYEKETLAMGWLHDVLEDTSAKVEELNFLFGEKVAEGVYLLTRNVDREEYKQRLSLSPLEVQLVKLADTLHNVSTLEQLKPRGIKRKIDDCQEFYLPLAKIICPEMGKEISGFLNEYNKKQGGNVYGYY